MTSFVPTALHCHADAHASFVELCWALQGVSIQLCPVGWVIAVGVEQASVTLPEVCVPDFAGRYVSLPEAYVRQHVLQ